MTAMEMLSRAALSYCHVGKNEGAACRSLLTLCKWLLADWKDMTPQLKQACSPVNTALPLLNFGLNFVLKCKPDTYMMLLSDVPWKHFVLFL